MERVSMTGLESEFKRAQLSIYVFMEQVLNAMGFTVNQTENVQNCQNLQQVPTTSASLFSKLFQDSYWNAHLREHCLVI